MCVQLSVYARRQPNTLGPVIFQLPKKYNKKILTEIEKEKI